MTDTGEGFPNVHGWCDICHDDMAELARCQPYTMCTTCADLWDCFTGFSETERLAQLVAIARYVSWSVYGQ